MNGFSGCGLAVALLVCARTASAADKAPAAPATPLAAPSNTETPQVLREWKEGGDLVRAFVSSARPNGAAGAFGAWFGLTSSAPPDGYRLKSATFHLVGDRFCAGTDASPAGAGTSAECRQDLRDDRAARWAFRMQGHDDGIDPERWSMGFSIAPGQLVTSGPAGTSRGVLICTYTTAPRPAPAK